MANLDVSAFPRNAVEESATAEASQAQSGENNENPATPSAVEGVTVPEGQVEEQKVPYSRMKSVIEARREAERRAEEAEIRLQEVLSQGRETRQEQSNSDLYQGALPPYWVKMYGDNENSRFAYNAELERQDAIRSEARREALEAVRQERTQEVQVLAQNERSIDERLEDLSYSLGRDLTEQEQEAILDIVDEYTPTGDDGKYAGELLPFEKAWEILSLKQGQSNAQVNRQRRAPTVLTATPTQGEITGKENADKEWNPMDWNSWRKKIPN